MAQELTPDPDRRSFEERRQVNQHGAEYWSARDLQPLLGYSQWRRFEEAVQRAVTSCQQSGNDPKYHFVGAGKMVTLGSSIEREIPDFHLSRFALFLNGNRCLAINPMSRIANAIIAILLLFLIAVSHASAGNIVPPTAEHYIFRGVVTDGATGEPAPDAVVTWRDSGGEECPIWLDSEGCFQSLMGEPVGWWSAAYARRGNRISQLASLLMLGDREAAMDLGLGATMSGRVVDEQGNPVAGAVVGVVPCRMRGDGFFDGVTNDDGYYQVEGIAPGCYEVILEHPDYSGTGLGNWPDGNIELVAGGALQFNVNVKERQMTIVSGTVLGPDGTPAAKVLVSAFHDSHPFATTDDFGRFSFPIKVEYLSSSKIAFERYPLGRAMLDLASYSDKPSDITVQMPGTARFTGKVTGPNGEVVPLARVQGRNTDAMGNYDTGWISLLNESGRPVDLYAGNQAVISDYVQGDTSRTSQDRPLYHTEQIPVRAAHGEDQTVNIQLEPVQIRVVRGTVRDETGNPVADAVVAVYEGNADADQWIKDMAERIPDRPERYPWMPRSTIDVGEPSARRLARIRSGADGRWEARIPRLPYENTDWLGRKPDPNRLTIVASDASLERTAISRFTITDPAPDMFEADATLCPIEEELIGYVFLEGPDGQPMPDVTFSINRYGPHASDERGALRIPHLSGAVQLELVTPGLRIASAQFIGVYDELPPPSSNFRSEGPMWGYLGRSPEGNRADPDPPNLCRGEQTLSYRFFDPEQGVLHIALEPASN